MARPRNILLGVVVLLMFFAFTRKGKGPTPPVPVAREETSPAPEKVTEPVGGETAPSEANSAALPTPIHVPLNGFYDLLDDGRYDAALAALTEVLKADPSHAEALLEMGLLYAYLLNQPERALPYLRKSVEKDPENPTALDELLKVTAKLGGPAQAANILKDLYRTNPGSPNLGGEIGRLLSSQGKYTEAIPLLERVLKRTGESDQSLSSLANAYEMIGKIDNAVLLYRRRAALQEEALKDTNDSSPELQRRAVNSQLDLADVLIQTQHLDEARAILQRMATTVPGDASVQLLLRKLEAAGSGAG